MGSSNKSPRHQIQFTSDFPDKKIYPKDCVPMNRPHGSWTNGVKAYERGVGGASNTWVGWFHPPRLRNKGHKNRYKSNLRKRDTPYNQFTHPLHEEQALHEEE